MQVVRRERDDPVDDRQAAEAAEPDDAYLRVLLVLTAVIWFAVLSRPAPGYMRGVGDACVMMAAGFPIVTAWVRGRDLDWNADLGLDWNFGVESTVQRKAIRAPPR